MQIDSVAQGRLQAMFGPLNSASASRKFPPPEALSKALDGILLAHGNQPTINIDERVASLFGTAGVDMWLRALHSFIISTALTSTSPIWASVSGYYSSHYSIRALAHLLGYFQLFRKARLAQFSLRNSGKPFCRFEPKGTKDGEHALYWRIVNDDPHFTNDPLFIANTNADVSDVNHRNGANYADHLLQCPPIHALNEAQIRSRIDHISSISFTAPPIPRRSSFPDVESVQIVAYHRLIKVRDFLDTTVSSKNRFWKTHRTPEWSRAFTDLQLVEQRSSGPLQSM